MISYKNVLVLGTGFVSKNIFEQKELIRSNIKKVISVSRSDDFSYSDRHVKTDFSNIKAINAILKEENINSVYIFFGPSFPSISFDNSFNDINSYLIPFIKLLKLAHNYNIEEIIMLGSAGTVYGSELDKNFQEDNVIMQKNTYGALLKMMENYLIIHSNMYNFNFKILRLSNVFGIHHESQENGFINLAIRKTISNKTISLFSSTSKNYIYSKDIGQIFWSLDKIDKSNYIVNISSDFEFSTIEICERIKSILPRLRYDTKISDKNYDTIHPKISNLRLNSLIKFDFTPFQEAIIETIQWEKTKLN
jgi:UDP-glucose 4-epimerase